ncbi:hypothetical protein [Chromohalobacter sp. 296-RDG]|uniref:hypothetical protein n=1 Tax=Chromohalobacter sp. 296-RDG TaxID=2994062 RepID=UPI00246843BA|nr:hypothetical protein [Chromohalobacter sp. 296-RDG]
MRVKIGNQWHDSNDEPICIQVSEGEQKQIASIDRSVAPNGIYAIFPDNWRRQAMLDWMQSGEDAGVPNE